MIFICKKYEKFTETEALNRLDHSQSKKTMINDSLKSKALTIWVKPETSFGSYFTEFFAEIFAVKTTNTWEMILEDVEALLFSNSQAVENALAACNCFGGSALKLGSTFPGIRQLAKLLLWSDSLLGSEYICTVWDFYLGSFLYGKKESPFREVAAWDIWLSAAKNIGGNELEPCKKAGFTNHIKLGTML